MTAAPQLLTLTCSECGGEFNATRRDARTCSDKCRQDRCPRLKLAVSEELIESGFLEHIEGEDIAASAMAAVSAKEIREP